MVRASRLCVAASRSPHAPLIAPTITSPLGRSAIGRYDGDAALRVATAAPPMVAAPDMVARMAPYTPVLIVSCTTCTGLAGGPVSVKGGRAGEREGAAGDGEVGVTDRVGDPGERLAAEPGGVPEIAGVSRHPPTIA